MSDTSSPLTVMSSPLSELSEPPGSPEPFELPPAIEEASLPVETSAAQDRRTTELSQDQPDQPETPAEAGSSNEDVDLFGDGDIAPAPEESGIITIDERSPGRSPPPEAPIDLSRESPELIPQSGNIVQVRWAGNEGEEDLVIEVDENGYEIPKETGVSVNHRQGGIAEEGAEEDLQVEGERGVRTLLDICRGIMMRCASRYDDIGDLQYQQHPLFFSSMSAKQLEQLEGNSPGIKGDTDHLWKRFVMQKSLPDYKTYEKEPPKSWRRVYKHLLREEERKILQAAEDMKASYAAEEREKLARRTQLTSATLQDLGYRKKSLTAAGPSRAKPTLLGRVREKTMQERKFRAPPSLPSGRASAVESLIFPTSGPYATLGAFHPSATTQTLTTKDSKESSLPAPPFLYPSQGLRQQIREAGDPSLSAAPGGTPAPKEKLLKNGVPEEDSDSDEVTFVSSTKGKKRSRVTQSPPVAVRETPPKSAPETHKRKRPVDMDFFSIPSTSSASSRQTIRRSSTQQIFTDSRADRSVGSTSQRGVSSPQSHISPSRPEVAALRASIHSPASTVRPTETSRTKLNTTLFVPKRRKVH